MGADNVHIGPSDYVQWLDDRKWAYIRMEGRTFGDVPLNIELKLEVVDSPNSAGIVIDAVRCAKLASTAASPARSRARALLHEVAAGAVPRRPVPPHDRGVHRRRRPRRQRRLPGLAASEPSSGAAAAKPPRPHRGPRRARGGRAAPARPSSAAARPARRAACGSMGA